MRVNFLFDTNTEKMILTLLLLKRLVKIQATVRNSRPLLAFYLFDKKLMVKIIKPKSGGRKLKGMELVKLAEPHDISINTNYGFRDPFTTGIVCGAIGLAAPLANVDSVNNVPDFHTDTDYIHLDASAKIDTGSTLMRILRARISN